MHVKFSVCSITRTLTVKIVPDKCTSSVAQNTECLRIPVVLKSFSRQKDRRYDPFVKHTLDKFAEHGIRFFCFVFIEHRIYHRQFLHVGTGHFIYCHKCSLASSQPRTEPAKHVCFDLVSVTAEQSCIVLPKFLRLIKQVIAETLLIILYKNMSFINIHPGSDPAQHLCQFFGKRRNSKYNAVDHRK